MKKGGVSLITGLDLRDYFPTIESFIENGEFSHRHDILHSASCTAGKWAVMQERKELGADGDSVIRLKKK